MEKGLEDIDLNQGEKARAHSNNRHIAKDKVIQFYY